METSTNNSETPEENEMKVYFSEGDELLIDLVRSYPFLYDKTKREYKDVRIKENAWKETATVLHLPGKEVEVRWQRMRERFSKERKALELPFGSGSTIIKSKWPLYKKMSFLNEHVRRRRTLSNTSSIDPGADCKSPDICTVNSEVEFDQLDRSSTPAYSSSTIPSNGSGSGNFKRRKVSDTIDCQVTALSSALCTFLNQRNEAGNQNTSEDQIVILVSSELKKMPTEIQRERKRRIMDLLYEPF